MAWRKAFCSHNFCAAPLFESPASGLGGVGHAPEMCGGRGGGGGGVGSEVILSFLNGSVSVGPSGGEVSISPMISPSTIFRMSRTI